MCDRAAKLEYSRKLNLLIDAVGELGRTVLVDERLCPGVRVDIARACAGAKMMLVQPTEAGRRPEDLDVLALIVEKFRAPSLQGLLAQLFGPQPQDGTQFQTMTFADFLQQFGQGLGGKPYDFYGVGLGDYLRQRDSAEGQRRYESEYMNKWPYDRQQGSGEEQRRDPYGNGPVPRSEMRPEPDDNLGSEPAEHPFHPEREGSSPIVAPDQVTIPLVEEPAPTVELTPEQERYADSGGYPDEPVSEEFGMQQDDAQRS